MFNKHFQKATSNVYLDSITEDWRSDMRGTFSHQQSSTSSKNVLVTTEEINKAETLLLFPRRRKKNEEKGKLKEMKRQIYVSRCAIASNCPHDGSEVPAKWNCSNVCEEEEPARMGSNKKSAPWKSVRRIHDEDEEDRLWCCPPPERRERSRAFSLINLRSATPQRALLYLTEKPASPLWR